MVKAWGSNNEYLTCSKSPPYTLLCGNLMQRSDHTSIFCLSWELALKTALDNIKGCIAARGSHTDHSADYNRPMLAKKYCRSQIRPIIIKSATRKIPHLPSWRSPFSRGFRRFSISKTEPCKNGSCINQAMVIDMNLCMIQSSYLPVIGLIITYIVDRVPYTVSDQSRRETDG